MDNKMRLLIDTFSNKKGGLNSPKIRMSEFKQHLEYLLDVTSFLPSDVPLRFRFEYVKNGAVPKHCKTCSAILHDVRRDFCSSFCSNTNTEVIAKMTQTWHSKTSDDVSIIQNKRRATNLVRYGVEIASKLPSVIQKNKDSHFQRWGDYALNIPEIRDKKLATCMLRYSGIGMSSSIIYDKMKSTMMERYGVEHFSNTPEWYDKCVSTCREKHGKDWVSQVDEINYQQQTGGFSRHDFVFPSGNVVRVQGYEPLVLLELLSQYEEHDITVGIGNIMEKTGVIKYVWSGKTHRYYPDIFIEKDNLLIEVKSNYYFNKDLERNMKKRQAVLDAGFNFKFIVR